MASFYGPPSKHTRPEWAYAFLFLLIVVAALAIVGTVEHGSLNPENGCAWNEVLDARGVCR